MQGSAGVGKTSFVNRLKADLARQNVLVHEQPVRVAANMPLRSLVAEVLKALLRIHHAMEESPVSPRAGARSRPRVPGRERQTAGAFWRRVVRLVEGEDVTGGGMSVASVGVSVQQAVFRVFDQVGGIFPPAVTLAPLSPEEVGEMLERRYRHLIRGRHYTPPVTIDDAVRLYRGYHGDLRNFLRLLSAAAHEELGVRDREPLSRERILAVMEPRYRAKLAAQLGKTEFEHLRTILSRGSIETGFRVADVSAWTGVHQTTASQLVNGWLTSRLIEADRTEGRNTYYRPVGDTGIAFGRLS